jgi:5-methylcytosine-specific restriction enzyme A
MIEKSKNRVLAETGFVDPKDLPRGPNGRPLCRFCSNETIPPRRTFCSDICIHEWKIRSNPGYAREHVFKRDRGVCAGCGLDTEELKKLLSQVISEKGRAAYEALTFTYSGDYGFDFSIEKHFWEMDHILPVAHGGGTCGLENLQTLCIICHKEKTAEQLRKR